MRGTGGCRGGGNDGRAGRRRTVAGRVVHPGNGRRVCEGDYRLSAREVCLRLSRQADGLLRPDGHLLRLAPPNGHLLAQGGQDVLRVRKPRQLAGDQLLRPRAEDLCRVRGAGDEPQRRRPPKPDPPDRRQGDHYRLLRCPRPSHACGPIGPALRHHRMDPGGRH